MQGAPEYRRTAPLRWRYVTSPGPTELEIHRGLLIFGGQGAILFYKNLKAPVADLADLMTEMNVNVGGVLGMTSAFIDVLRANRGTVINVSPGLAFVPLPAAPIYSATKAAIHSYTQSLRYQLEETGVEVIEIMPPAVKTDMTTELAEGGASLITTDELVKQSFASLKSGALEIHPGQTKQLAFLRRLAPGFINKQLWKASKVLVPVETA